MKWLDTRDFASLGEFRDRVEFLARKFRDAGEDVREQHEMLELCSAR